MRKYTSLAHKIELITLYGGNLWIINPDIKVEITENGHTIYFSRAYLPHDSFEGVGLSSFNAIKSLNDAFNKKIGAQHADFLERNLFFELATASDINFSV